MRRVPRVTCICETCGKEFHRVPSMVGKFCSKQCYIEWQKENTTPPRRGRQIEYTCDYCGTKFMADESSKRKYCSRDCYEKHSSELRQGIRKEDTIVRKCLVCGKKMYVEKSKQLEGKGKFCSKECYAEWQHETMQGTPFPWKVPSGEDHPNYKGKIKVECDFCGEMLECYPFRYNEREHHFCSKECFYKYQSKTMRGKPFRGEHKRGEEHYLYKEKAKKHCVVCGKEFERYPYRADRIPFCSLECYNKGRFEYMPTVESEKHADLKNKALLILEDFGFDVFLERWVTLDKKHYKIDVYGIKENLRFLVECGQCSKSKLEHLETRFENVIHIPYKNREKKLKELKEYASTRVSTSC